MPGTLFIVATPIGNLEDITARALRVLREASIIAAEDTRRTAHLLARYGIATPTTSLHEHNETTKSHALIARLARGEHVALVSDAGTPAISDPGRTLVREAIAAGIRIEPVPGPTAVMAALAASGFESDSFTFMGFPPTRSKARAEWFERARRIGGTVVFFEAPHRIRRTLEELRERAGDVEAVVCRELTKVHEELVRGPITAVLERIQAPIGEFTVVVEIGHITENAAIETPEPADMAAELGRITENAQISRREAIHQLAVRYHLRPNQVYEALEEAKKSGE